MAAGLLFAGMMLAAGYAVVRLLGLAKGAAAAGLLPGAGLGFTAIVATWCGLLGVIPPVAGLLVLGTSLAGLGLAVRDREWLARSFLGFVRHDRLAAIVLAVAMIIPVMCMGIGFAQLQTPL